MGWGRDAYLALVLDGLERHRDRRVSTRDPRGREWVHRPVPERNDIRLKLSAAFGNGKLTHTRAPSLPPERRPGRETAVDDGGGGPYPTRGRRRRRAHREDTEAKPPPMEPLTPEILTAFYTNLDTVEDPDVASDDLATALGVPDRTTDSRNGSRVDFIFNTLDFARDAGYTPAQTIAVHDIGQAMLNACVSTATSFADAEALFQSLLLPKVSAEPDREGGQFSVTDVKAVSDYFAKGFFQHFNLWRFVYSEPQELDSHQTLVRLETAFPARALPDFLTEEADDARRVKEAEEAEAARVAAEEEAAAAAEAERLRLIEEEDARVKAEEAEYARRKPATLADAVEHAVKTALAQERGALEAEYATREKQLREKIAVLEQQMKAK